MDRNELEVIKSLKILGFKYLTRDKAGNLYAHKKRPELFGTIWACPFGDMLLTTSLVENAFNFLEGLSEEPFNIYNTKSLSKRYVNVNVVKGSEGFSLQIYNNNESGSRVHGPRAWGNPYNRPYIKFENVDADELIEAVLWNQYEIKEES